MTIHLLGFTLDWSLEPTDTEAEDDGSALNGGTTQGYFMAPVVNPEMPAEIPGVDRNNGWGDEE